MLTLSDLQQIITDISIGDENLYDAKLTILVRMDGTRPYLQIKCENAKDAKTGENTSWTSRKWMLSYHMCRSEVVRTAYKAYITALLHEADEQFRYKNVAIYGPHANVDVLADVLGKNVYVDTLGDELSPEDARDNGMTGV